MKSYKTGWGTSYDSWRVKVGKKTVFAGNKGDCEEFIRKNKGKLVPPNKPGKR